MGTPFKADKASLEISLKSLTIFPLASVFILFPRTKPEVLTAEVINGIWAHSLPPRTLSIILSLSVLISADILSGKSENFPDKYLGYSIPIKDKHLQGHFL